MERNKKDISGHKEYQFLKDGLIEKNVGLINKLNGGTGFIIRYGFKFYNDFYIEGDSHLLISFKVLIYRKGKDGFESIEKGREELLWSDSFIEEVRLGDEGTYRLRGDKYKVVYEMDDKKVDSLFKSFIDGLSC